MADPQPLTTQQLEGIAAVTDAATQLGADIDPATVTALLADNQQLRQQLEEMIRCRDNALRALHRDDVETDIDLEETIAAPFYGPGWDWDEPDLKRVTSVAADAVRPAFGKLTQERDKAREHAAGLEAQREALAARLRAGQRWRQGRNPALVSQDYVSQDELRAMFSIPLTAPWDAAEPAAVRPAATTKQDTDPRARQLAESRYRNGYGPTLAEDWDALISSTREFLIGEAASWLGAAITAGLLPPSESPIAISPPAVEDLAAADNPTQLRWGLNDVLWGDDNGVIVLLSGPDREPYWLELDPERAAVLRQDLAGPDGDTETDVPAA